MPTPFTVAVCRWRLAAEREPERHHRRPSTPLLAVRPWEFPSADLSLVKIPAGFHRSVFPPAGHKKLKRKRGKKKTVGPEKGRQLLGEKDVLQPRAGRPVLHRTISRAPSDRLLRSVTCKENGGRPPRERHAPFSPRRTRERRTGQPGAPPPHEELIITFLSVVTKDVKLLIHHHAF
ncbi:hypothetical protein EYF80_010667 [Liparis tanakae]|uniref:Uncharacterized protein n=1 Tax=Liparis tanakae TaxID=230148 RepID=A0A4Z2IMN6_9TELE|nr:hypothetical protein EYF80_010667 [Liparis tanakae]